jgi:hypothetical protein
VFYHQWFQEIQEQSANLSSIDELICHTFSNSLDVPESCFSRTSAQQPDSLNEKNSTFYPMINVPNHCPKSLANKILPTYLKTN